MDGFLQFIGAMGDSLNAALTGLNLAPAIGLSLLAGGLLPRKCPYMLQALGVVVLSVTLTALWPQIYGFGAIWPDLSELEAEMQLVILFTLSYALVRLAGLIRFSLLLFRKPA